MTYNLFEVYLIGLLLLFYICIFISMVMQAKTQLKRLRSVLDMNLNNYTL